MDDVELRYALLEKAKSLLLSEWEHKVKVEEALANFDCRAPAVIRQPTLHRILVLAEKLYGFVKIPPVNPVNPISSTNAKTSEVPTGLGVDRDDLLIAEDQDSDGSDASEDSDGSEDFVGSQEIEDDSPDISSEE